MPTANKQHKDRLFKFIFGNPEHKEWTLSLYNALNNSHFTNPEDVEFNTIEDAVYMGMKNDMSFILAFILNIWEHQSSFNPNIPFRILLYFAHVLEKYSAWNDTYRYGRNLEMLPCPKFVCFYNGLEEQPDEVILKLSDAFRNDGTEPDIELTVRMVNINYGHNKELMEKCRPLYEYAWFIDVIRKRQEVTGDLESAIDAAIDEMPNDFLLKKFLVGHRAEVKGMYLTEWDEERARAVWRKEAIEEGLAEGHAKGLAEGLAEGRAEGITKGLDDANRRVASDMLREKFPLSLIAKISRLSEENILSIAKTLGIAVV